MAVELGKFIADQLTELSADHPDRAFLEEELERVSRYNRPPEVVKAARHLESLLTFSASPQVVKDHAHIRDHTNNRLGKENAIVNLLPVECKDFFRVIFPLGRAKINTRKELIDLTPDRIKDINSIGKKKARIVLAMKDLAIAELKAKAPITSNLPQI